MFALITGEQRRAQLRALRPARSATRDRQDAAARLRAREGANRRLGNARTIAEVAGALVLLAAFVLNELRHRNPLAPLSIFRIDGLGFSDITQLIAFAGFLAMFFFLTLYMQNVLGYRRYRQSPMANRAEHRLPRAGNRKGNERRLVRARLCRCRGARLPSPRMPAPRGKQSLLRQRGGRTRGNRDCDRAYQRSP